MEKQNWSPHVETILQNLGNNRAKFEQVLEHYKEPKDSLKFQAACFLLEHINIHKSRDRIWTRKNNTKIDFDELSYENFEESLEIFDSIKKDISTIDAKVFQYSDADTLTTNYIIDNIEQAFKVRELPWAKNLKAADFYEYILPYRVSTEPVQKWRETYYEKNRWVFSHMENNGFNFEACRTINDSISTSFYSTHNIGRRQEPIPIIGPLNLIHRMQGDCADRVNYTVYCMRSIGIPTLVDFVPYWGTSSGRHFWNVTLDENGKANYFMGGGDNPGEFTIYSELPKVYRITYKKQSNSIGAKIGSELIPDELLKMPNLMDVTEKYVKTTNLKLNPGINYSGQAAFLCVLNNLKWRPVCGEIVGSDGTVHFKNIGCGIIYLPMVLNNNRFCPVDYPYSIKHSGEIERKVPNLDIKQQFVMNQEDGYLIYRPGKTYRLFYWNNKWELIKQSIYTQNKKLVFNNITDNAVLLMIPEYSWGKERPFTIENNSRIWW
jgi:hypothetical protein